MKKQKSFAPLEISEENISKVRKKRFLKGFTLIELLVVIIIIGLLATIVFVSLQGVKPKVRDAKRKIEFTQIRIALELYNDKYGHYPRQPFEGDFHNFVNSTQSQPWIRDRFDGTSLAEFINPIPVDPINQPNPNGPWNCRLHFVYVTDADGQIYDLAALLETKDQNRCENSCWKIYSVSDYEDEDYYWCKNCGGKFPYGVPSSNKCLFQMYADH